MPQEGRLMTRKCDKCNKEIPREIYLTIFWPSSDLNVARKILETCDDCYKKYLILHDKLLIKFFEIPIEPKQQPKKFWQRLFSPKVIKPVQMIPKRGRGRPRKK